MAVTKDRPAPYAPTSAILSVVERNRAGKLPAIVDADVLERSGVSASLIPRTLQALQVLDLIGEDGRKTDTFEAIRTAREEDYKTQLAEWLKDAYADALEFIDPATATEVDVRDAFRLYVPHGQQDRMVSLFMGLFTAAGVMPERQRAATPRKATGAMAGRVIGATPKPRFATPRTPTPTPTPAAGQTPSGLPPALVGLLQSLPANGKGWTQEERERFLKILEPMLDFCFPIVEAEQPANVEETAADQQ